MGPKKHSDRGRGAGMAMATGLKTKKVAKETEKMLLEKILIQLQELNKQIKKANIY